MACGSSLSIWVSSCSYVVQNDAGAAGWSFDAKTWTMPMRVHKSPQRAVRKVCVVYVIDRSVCCCEILNVRYMTSFFGEHYDTVPYSWACSSVDGVKE